MKKAIVLIQLGTPDHPTPSSVGRFLREFLSDPYVINLPWLARMLLVNGIIVPFRRHKSAKAYQKIWSEQGSPLRYHSEALQQQLQAAVGIDTTVKLAMRYGSPSIAQVLTELDQAACSDITILPLFPQYAAATSATALNQVMQYYAGKPRVPSLRMIHDFYDHPSFIQAWTQHIQKHVANQPVDHMVFSYHGLPVRQVKDSELGEVACDQQKPCPAIFQNNRFCYRAQCYATTRAIMSQLDQPHSVAFQSRLGRIPWIQPYLENHLQTLRDQGIEHLAIASPSFVADCLETVEELGIRTKETWMAMGGKSFLLIPSLNSQPEWVGALQEIARLNRAK